MFRFMQKFLSLYLLLLAGICFFPVSAIAEWVSLPPEEVAVSQSSAYDSDADVITFSFVFQNISEENIDGDLRFAVIPDAETAPPINADGIQGETGLHPTWYYNLLTDQAEVFQPLEQVSIDVQFAGSSAAFDTCTVEVNDSSGIFRKNISKTAEFYSGEADIEIMPIYVPAQSSAGVKLCMVNDCSDYPDGDYIDTDEGLVCPCSETYDKPWMVKPIIVKYIQEEEETAFNSVPDYTDETRLAHDIYVAVSYDEGSSWKRKNISRTAVKSSFTLENGVEYPGDSEKSGDKNISVVGPYVLVTWVDKLGASGNPWDLTDADDIYQVVGPQRSVDYLDVTGDEEPRPDLGERPFSCVWAARGVLDMNAESVTFGTITWFKGEQLSTGRRDAFRVFTAGIEPINGSNGKPLDGTGGFALVWQEDPKGLKPGHGKGPGVGMSGAGVNHKTDIWYSHIHWNDFDKIDVDYVPNGDSLTDNEEVRPHPLHTFNPPIRVSDNSVCRERIPEDAYGYLHDIEHTACGYTYEGGTTSQPVLWDDLPADWVCPQCGLGKDTFVYGIIKQKHVSATYCQNFANNPRVDKDGNYLAPEDPGYADGFFCADGEWITDENGEWVWSGEPLDGDTGASRANLVLTNWDGETLAVIAYEETKGEGIGKDKVAAAPEQLSPVPINVFEWDENGHPLSFDGPLVNADCVSCHYLNITPRDMIFPFDQNMCEMMGCTWVGTDAYDAYFPYEPYPLPEGIIPMLSEENRVGCLKFLAGKKICPTFSDDPDCNYTALPEHLPGYHRISQDCISCHVVWGTKDLDKDYIPDRFDQCLGTAEGESVDMDQTSPWFGCSEDQIANPDDGDHVQKIRHGKNIIYHSFYFGSPEAISRGYEINLPNSMGKYENARRVRVVPQALYDGSPNPVTLGLLYKQGIDGQGAPADAYLRLFKGGFDPENLQAGDLNLSSCSVISYMDTELPYLNPDGTDTCVYTGTPNPDYDVDQNGHKSPKIEAYEWTAANLADDSGWKFDLDEDGVIDTGPDGYPIIHDNPYENVFSTRLSIRGDDLVVGFAHCANWAAGRKAKDHYDFYVRVSEDGGSTWTIPTNVSKLKNHKETTSDCRILQPPTSIFTWKYDKQDGLFYYTIDSVPYGDYSHMKQEDFHHHDAFLVAIGTKENTPQPTPGDPECVEEEIFLDVYYTRTTDRGQNFSVLNPKYDPEAPLYLDANGYPTDEPGLCALAEDDTCMRNPDSQEHLAMDWIAKGDALQGDVQFACSPDGSKIYDIWEQELPIDPDASQTHFQGADVWFRKIEYPDPAVDLPGDLDLDGDIDNSDGVIMRDLVGTSAMNRGFRWDADFKHDNLIDDNDYKRWKFLLKSYQK